MSDPYGPKRRQTKPIPRAELPPAMGSVPDLSEKRWDPTALTMEECPACKTCECCGGQRLVPQEIAAAYRASLAREADEEEVAG